MAPETSVAVWHWVLTECRAPAVGPSQPAGLGLGPTVLQKPVAKKNTDELSFIGLSVEWLSTTLLRWVEEAGLDPTTAKIYEIEPAVIRPRSAGTRCPVDHRPGAALVHAVEGGVDAVGKATYMISCKDRNASGHPNPHPLTTLKENSRCDTSASPL